MPWRLGSLLLLMTWASACRRSVTYGEVIDRHRAELEAIETSMTTMRGLIANPASPDDPCSHPGLVSARASGDAGATIELLDARVLEHADEPVQPGRLILGLGPLATVYQQVHSRVNTRDLRMVSAAVLERPLAATSAVKYVLVSKTGDKDRSALPARVDLYLFEYPAARLVCSFALDNSDALTLAGRNGYDPRTGETVGRLAAPGKSGPSSIDARYQQELSDRFDIVGRDDIPVVHQGKDDPRVRERARKVSAALDTAASSLPVCQGATGPRLSKKALRIVAGGPLLEWRDPNVEIDPTNSKPVASYLATRDPASADELLKAERWSVVEIQSGRAASSVDGRSFVGGAVAGRLVSFDAAATPLCQRAFSTDPATTLQAQVTTGTGGAPDRNDLAARSRAQLREQIDAKLGAP